jgi:hypothetical protein
MPSKDGGEDVKSWWRVVAAYPPTWIAIALVIGVVWMIFFLFDPPTLFSIVLIVLGFAAIIFWPLTMSATGTLAHLQFAVPRVPEVDEDELADLRFELEELDDQRAAHQLSAIREKRDNLVEVLDRRLEAGEMTYARYLSTAQQVYISALDNLHEVALAEQSVSTIDDEYIGNRLEELSDSDSVKAQSEITSLEDRLSLMTSQQDKIVDLLAQNESAMTLIDRTSTALADAPIGRTPQDAEAAMEALNELAERASKYATS